MVSLAISVMNAAKWRLSDAGATSADNANQLTGPIGPCMLYTSAHCLVATVSQGILDTIQLRLPQVSLHSPQLFNSQESVCSLRLRSLKYEKVPLPAFSTGVSPSSDLI